MNWFRLPLTCYCILLISNIGWGQIQMKLDQVPGTSHWGVYVKLCEDAIPSGNTITGSGQITIVHAAGQTITAPVSVYGNWVKNATVTSPAEAAAKAYTSIGFVVDDPQIIYDNEEETLLFTFELNGTTGGLPYLIDNESDPFNQLPNSSSTNPGNELSVIDMGTSPVGFYFYEGNYTGVSIDCSDVPQDTTVVDTTVVTNPDTTTQGGGGGENPTPTIEEIVAKGYFTLSPNPTHEWLNVEFKDKFVEETGVLRFWTVSGIPIGEMKKGQQEKMTLNVGSLPDGLYFLSFEVDGLVKQRARFLKQ